MILDKIYLEDWEVVIVYEATCDDIDQIIKLLKEINCPNIYIKEALNNLEECKLNSGLTYSNLNLKKSVIVINKTSTISQLVNTISHEYYHLICHIAKAFEIEDEEELAYLNGDLNMRSYLFVKRLEKEVGSE